MNHKLLYDLDLPDLTALLQSWDEPSFRAQQIWQRLYRHFWNAPDQFTNLPNSLRTRLAENLRFNTLTPYETLKVFSVNLRHVKRDGLAYQDTSQPGKPLGLNMPGAPIHGG